MNRALINKMAADIIKKGGGSFQCKGVKYDVVEYHNVYKVYHTDTLIAEWDDQIQQLVFN